MGKRDLVALLFLSSWILVTTTFETIHCVNLNTQRQKRHDVTKNVKFNFLTCGLGRCMKKHAILANILFTIQAICAMEFAEKFPLIHSCLEFA